MTTCSSVSLPLHTPLGKLIFTPLPGFILSVVVLFPSSINLDLLSSSIPIPSPTPTSACDPARLCLLHSVRLLLAPGSSPPHLPATSP